MRIVYVCADRGIPVYSDKGASIHIQEMVRAFVALGHEVKVVCARVGNGSEVNDSLNIVSIAPIGEAPTNREEKERAAMTLSDAMTDHLVALYQYWPFDFIYERYSLWSSAGCRAGTMLKIPTIVEVNAPLVEEQSTFRELALHAEARDIEAEVYRSAAALASVSKQMSDYLIKHGAPADRVHTIGNAVNTELFKPAVRAASIESIDEEHFVVGFSGSLKMWHGLDILLMAFQQFHRLVPTSRLLIVGDGPKRGWAEGFVAGAGLADVVVFTGWVSHELLPSYLARMDVATASYPPSPSHYFSPLKLYEYLAMGRPIVATRIGQTAELLSGDKKALLVEPGNVEAFAEAFVKLHNSPVLADNLSNEAAKEGKQHDWRDNARCIIEIATANGACE